MTNKVLERLEKRKAEKAGKTGEVKLSVVKEETAAEGINPPEGADQSEPLPDEDKPGKNPVTGRTPKKRPAKDAPVKSGEPLQAGGVLMRALEAAWEVLAEDIAERVKNRK